MASPSSSQEEQRGTGISYSCRLCGASRSRRSLILSHMQKSHPQALSEFSTVGKDRRIYQCSKCEVTRSSIAKLHKHMRDDHSCALGLPSQRSAIASFSSSSSSSSEEDKKDPNRRYCCRICGASRTKRSLILSHMQKSHPNSLSEFCVVGKDRRIYTCVACGVTRSTISMLRKHMQASHPCALQSRESDSSLLPGTRKRKRFECDECGWLAKKPSLLQQHLHTHSTEKPYSCPEEGCGKCFKLPYHLNRHALQHQEKGCLCPRVGCISVCSNRSNLRRHLQLHDLKPELKQQGTEESMKRFQCPESDCNLIFRYSCRLESHCDTAHGLKYTEIRCGEPGCGKGFVKAADLLEHIRESHGMIVCEICGFTVSRKSFRRHFMRHESSKVKQQLFCPFDGCAQSFSNASNLSVHLRVCHLGKREFVCSFDGCNKAFGYRHVRDNHERSSCHCYAKGDFEEEDIKFQAGFRGGRKPTTLQKVEDLFRKRVLCPSKEQGGCEDVA